MRLQTAKECTKPIVNKARTTWAPETVDTVSKSNWNLNAKEFIPKVV